MFLLSVLPDSIFLILLQLRTHSIRSSSVSLGIITIGTDDQACGWFCDDAFGFCLNRSCLSHNNRRPFCHFPKPPRTITSPKISRPSVGWFLLVNCPVNDELGNERGGYHCSSFVATDMKNVYATGFLNTSKTWSSLARWLFVNYNDTCIFGHWVDPCSLLLWWFVGSDLQYLGQSYQYFFFKLAASIDEVCDQVISSWN